MNTVNTLRKAFMVDGVSLSKIKGGGVLDDWIETVADIEIKDLGVGDLCRGIRQRIYISHLKKFILEKLFEDINAGEIYEGELIAALNGLESGFWKADHSFAKALSENIRSNMDEVDQEIVKEVNELLKKLPNE